MTETAIVYGEQGDIGRYALAHCVNALAARGIETFAARAAFQIPADRENTCLYDLKKKWKKMAGDLPFFLETEETEGGRCPAVSLPCALVTAEGRTASKSPEGAGGSGPECPEAAGELDLLVAGSAGLEGMLRIGEEKGEILSRRFAPSFLRLIRASQEQIFALDTAAAARRAQIPVIRHVGQGGVFKALWDLSARSGAGRGSEEDPGPAGDHRSVRDFPHQSLSAHLRGMFSSCGSRR